MDVCAPPWESHVTTASDSQRLEGLGPCSELPFFGFVFLIQSLSAQGKPASRTLGPSCLMPT